jgi:hypothetical protein
MLRKISTLTVLAFIGLAVIAGSVLARECPKSNEEIFEWVAFHLGWTNMNSPMPRIYEVPQDKIEEIFVRECKRRFPDGLDNRARKKNPSHQRG